VDESDAHPVGDERGLAFYRRFQESEGWMIGLRPVWKVASKRVVSQEAEGVGVTQGGELFEGANADVTGRDAGKDRTGKRLLAEDRFSGGGHGEAAGGRDAEGVHGLADEVFAQHGAEGGPAIPAARIRSGAGAFQLDVVALA
jgi:hypothetical protein